nr:MAG TPA: Heterocyst differentiation control protein [Caudoviricetes sp.]
MLVEDKTKYFWVDNGGASEPQDSIKDAIADYLEYISYFGDVARDRDIEWVRVGHPWYYVPKIDGERVLWNLIEYDMDDEIKEWSDDYLNDVKKEHIDELSEELTKVFRAWEKKYGFENNALVVFETKKYRISDYVKE